MQKVFVGDVQGCYDEFDELIERAAARFADAFEIWQVGDLVNRGPQNLRVLERMKSLVSEGRGRCVLGNHEIALVRAWLGLRTMKPGETAIEVLRHSDSAMWMEWLRGRPLVESGSIAGKRFAMVHASVHPDWSLEELELRARRVEERLRSPSLDDVRELLSDDFSPDPAVIEDRDVLGRLTRSRSVDSDGGWSSALPADDSVPWHSRWSSSEHDYGVVYGHWALQGLHVARGLRGLDTGCVHHGRSGDRFLTAWIPDEAPEARGTHGDDPFDVPDDRFWQIPARRCYADISGRARD